MGQSENALSRSLTRLLPRDRSTPLEGQAAVCEPAAPTLLLGGYRKSRCLLVLTRRPCSSKRRPPAHDRAQSRGANSRPNRERARIRPDPSVRSLGSARPRLLRAGGTWRRGTARGLVSSSLTSRRRDSPTRGRGCGCRSPSSLRASALAGSSATAEIPLQAAARWHGGGTPSQNRRSVMRNTVRSTSARRWSCVAAPRGPPAPAERDADPRNGAVLIRTVHQIPRVMSRAPVLVCGSM